MKTLSISWLFLAAIVLLGMAFTLLKPRKKIVFFGDSITQAAVKPGGYIDVLNRQLAENGKAEKLELIGAGISGNKVPDLQRRLEKDVLSHNPDRVFIYIGINDVWHYTHPCCKDNGGGTPADKFESGLKDIIRQLEAKGASVVLCTPSVIGEKKNGENAQDQMLDQYVAISRKIAKETGTRLCDLRVAFVDYLKQNNPQNEEKGILTTDGVHLNEKGNALVAEQMATYLK